MDQAAQQAKGRRLIRQARATNARRDAAERQSGWAAPSDTGVFHLLRTAMFAIEAGVVTGDWPCVAEGYVMIEEAVSMLAPDVNPVAGGHR